jgi:OTU domain-containing protein 3
MADDILEASAREPEMNEIKSQSAPEGSLDVRSLFSKTKKKIKAQNVASLPPPPPPPAPIDYSNRESQSNDEGWEREYQRLDVYLGEHGLEIEKVPDDGSCLFSAIACHFPGVTADDLRQEAVKYMLSHPGDFEPFIDTEAYPNGFSDYCMRMAKSQTWGSQLELQAISQSRRVNVYVFQTGGQSTIKMINFDPEAAQCVTVSYHDGQHYNTVIPIDRTVSLTSNILEDLLVPKGVHIVPSSYTDNNSSKKPTKKKSLFN